MIVTHDDTFNSSLTDTFTLTMTVATEDVGVYPPISVVVKAGLSIIDSYSFTLEVVECRHESVQDVDI